MDAVYTHFNKTVLFLATALLMVVPGRAQTPSFVLNGSGGANLPIQLYSNQASSVTVTSSMAGTTEISFTATVAYASVDQPWLSAWPTQGSHVSGTTATTLYLQASYSGPLVLSPAVITLTATSPSGVTSATITVTYTGNGSGANGTITATPSSVTLYAGAGGIATPATVALSGNVGINFGFSSLVTSPAGGSWLGAALTAGYGLSTPSNLTISANAYGLSNGYTYYGTVTVTPTNGASSTPIYVTLVVGSGGTGNLTANPSYFSWSYTTNSSFPTPQSVALTDAVYGQTTYTASVDSTSPWLEVNGSYPSTSGYIGSGITVGPNPTYMNSLASGSYTGYVHVSDVNGNTALITVYLTVNGGTTSGITWSPNPVTITAATGGSQQQLQVNLSSATAGTFTVSIGGSGLSVSGVSITSTTPAAGYVILYGNPFGLSSTTYSGSLYVTLTPISGNTVSQTIPVTFTVGSSGIIPTSGIVTPTSLTFAYQTGTTVTGTTLPSQSVVVSGTGQFSVAAPTYTSGQPSGWLHLTPASGYAPGTISVSVDPTSLVPNATPYTAALAVTPAIGASPVNISVSFLVSTSPVLLAYPGSLNFNYTAGGTPPSWTVWLNASDNSALPLTATTTTNWLTVNLTGGPATNTAVSVQGNNLSSLGNGVYTGSVTVTATGAANSPVNVPVVLTVTGSTVTGGGLTLGNLSTFYATQGGAAPASQTLSVGASTTTSYTANASSNGNWLSISPSGNLNTAANPSLTVSVVNQSGLTVAGSPYYGTITLTANGITQQVQVTLVVSSSGSGGGTGNVTVSAGALSFTYTVGGNAPSPQTLQVTSASGSAGILFTISSSANWLSPGVSNGSTLLTPETFAVSLVTPIYLTPSSIPYTATMTITPNGGTVVTIPVTLLVQPAATVTATATPLSFTFEAGGTDPSPQTVSVSGGGQSLGFTAQITAGSNWLSVSPASGTTPTTGTATLTVTATPLEANLGVGSYLGTLLVSGTGTGAGSSTSINVTLTVTAPLPTINSVVNAASFLKGPVSPGEIVTLFGTSMGPATAAYATKDASTGKLATTIGGVQVFFSGTAAPMIYASATQISAIVPYELAPIASPSVWVKYVGQTSNAYALASATTAPGLFTQNASGSGPGAILNQNLSLNGPGNPAAKGSIVMVYMTGEGQTSPGGVTGAITIPNLPPPQVTPAPLLPVSVLVNGQPALWTYAGEAPGLAAGLMQLNVQIPSTAQSGIPNSIMVYIGSNMSQSGVTVSVQ